MSLVLGNQLFKNYLRHFFWREDLDKYYRFLSGSSEDFNEYIDEEKANGFAIEVYLSKPILPPHLFE